MRDYKNFQNIETILNKAMTDALDAWAKEHCTCTGEYDLIDRFEFHTYHAYRRYVHDWCDDFDWRDYMRIIEQNRFAMMQIRSASKKLGLPYDFSFLYPYDFIGDFFSMIAREYVTDFLNRRPVAKLLVKDAFTFDWKAEYILSHELADYVGTEEGRISRLVAELIHRAKAED